MKGTLMTLALFGLVACAGPARSEDASKATPSTTNKTTAKQTFLGVGVEAVPAAVASHMPNVIPKDEGVMVTQVAKDSPAAKAGLEANDILLTFDGKKIDSPAQFLKLVHGDKPGAKAKIGFVRGGKTMTSDVTLGERAQPATNEEHHTMRFIPDERFQEMFEEIEGTGEPTAWKTFDAMKLTRTDSDHWRAEIEYRNKDNKQEKKTFEGTRTQIRKDIMAAKDLPANERQHLLRAMSLQEPVFEFQFPFFDNGGQNPGKEF